jgi:hypothetical protein
MGRPTGPTGHMYRVKVILTEDGAHDFINVASNEHARKIMDTYLATGNAYGMDWFDQAGRLIVKVRPGSDPLDPRILTILEAK